MKNAKRDVDAPDAAGSIEPLVIVSRCLGFAAVRYDGRILEGGFVNTLREHVEFLPVCPEIGIGLGVPRDPIRLVRVDGGTRLFQPSTGRDLTGAMKDYAERTLDRDDLPRRLDGAVLKSRSPSCGLGDARIYDAAYAETPAGRASGLFAREIRNRLPWVATVDEEALSDSSRRLHFLVHLWILAELRGIAESGRAADLLHFHETRRALVDATGVPDSGRELEEIVEKVAARGPEAASPEIGKHAEAYRRVLGTALGRSDPGAIGAIGATAVPTPLRGHGARA